ncbi:hypothetical protein B0H34DRAFT_858728 [Crassisporium funariophilum]|nr:hypothetical protein B0H34DRAFT_858728 [Crassisporium funariophilum]
MSLRSPRRVSSSTHTNSPARTFWSQVLDHDDEKRLFLLCSLKKKKSRLFKLCKAKSSRVSEGSRRPIKKVRFTPDTEDSNERALGTKRNTLYNSCRVGPVCSSGRSLLRKRRRPLEEMENDTTHRPHAHAKSRRPTEKANCAPCSGGCNGRAPETMRNTIYGSGHANPVYPSGTFSSRERRSPLEKRRTDANERNALPSVLDLRALGDTLQNPSNHNYTNQRHASPSEFDLRDFSANVQSPSLNYVYNNQRFASPPGLDLRALGSTLQNPSLNHNHTLRRTSFSPLVPDPAGILGLETDNRQYYKSACHLPVVWVFYGPYTC